ncbi:amino acid ABC transporter permease [Tatumella morbirosei]|uniref:amino acid ABC transporter permease n=1 Tax=Tatumella morbirosei TaxID=642227 RepID=UPI000699EDBD|nr:ABC transporter permease subunit [Tatumella morbirosei]
MDKTFLFTSTPFILSGLGETLQIIVLSLLFSLIAGGVVCLISLKVKHRALQQLIFLYLSLTRSIPVIVLMYMVFYTLPYLLVALFNLVGIHGISAWKLKLPQNVAAIASLVFVYSGYFSEFFRSAWSSVDSGQWEAAKAVNLPPFSSFRRIIFPQMMVANSPAFCNVVMDLIKDSALASTIGVIDVVAKSNIVSAQTFNYVESYLIVYILFVGLGLLFAKAIDLIIKKTLI